MTIVERGANSLALGGARMFFNLGGHLGAAGNGFKNLGNVVSFNEPSALTKLPHFAFIADSLTRAKDLDIVSEQTRGFQAILDDLGPLQWDLISSGDGLTTVTQSGDTITDEHHTAPVDVDGNSVMFTEETNVSSLTVYTSGTTAAMTLGTDYQFVNPVTGEIRVIDGGAITTALGLTFDYTSAARVRKTTSPGKTPVLKGALRVEYQTQNGNPMTYISHNVVMSTSTPPDFASDAYATFTVDFDILVDSVVDTTRPFGRRWIG